MSNSDKLQVLIIEDCPIKEMGLRVQAEAAGYKVCSLFEFNGMSVVPVDDVISHLRGQINILNPNIIFLDRQIPGAQIDDMREQWGERILEVLKEQYGDRVILSISGDPKDWTNVSQFNAVIPEDDRGSVLPRDENRRVSLKDWLRSQESIIK